MKSAESRRMDVSPREPIYTDESIDWEIREKLNPVCQMKKTGENSYKCRTFAPDSEVKIYTYFDIIGENLESKQEYFVKGDLVKVTNKIIPINTMSETEVTDYMENLLKSNPSTAIGMTERKYLKIRRKLK